MLIGSFPSGLQQWRRIGEERSNGAADNDPPLRVEAFTADVLQTIPVSACVQSHADNPEVLSALSIERAEADCSSDAGSDVGAEAPGPLLVQVSGAADPMFNKRYRRKRAIIWQLYGLVRPYKGPLYGHYMAII